MSKAVVLLSGGIDSAVVAAKAMSDGNDVIAISFDYGQRHIRELFCAKKITKHLRINEHFFVKINLAQWGGSLLTNSKDLGSNKKLGTFTNYVPGRNTVFIAIALSLAEAKGASSIYLGFNLSDRHHPDTLPIYLQAFEKLASVSSKAAVA